MNRQSARSALRGLRGVRISVTRILVSGTLLVLAVLVLNMSQAAPRTAGSDRVRPLQFTAQVPGGGTVCQSIEALPPGAARAELLIGTYYRPLPPLGLRFVGARGQTVGLATLSGGGRQGYVALPILRAARAQASRACLHNGSRYGIAVGGNTAPAGPDSEQINGKPQPGKITIFYLRAGSETWWQLLPVLDRRFGLGKAPFFGGWALPVVALLVVLLWAASLRVLRRELG